LIAKRRLQIYLDVLRAINDGTEKPTRIMYQARLSWGILNDSLSSLVRQGHVEAVEVALHKRWRSGKIYRITQKGESTLKYFEQGEDLFRLEEANLSNIMA